jgi:hypothetical protein
VKPWSPQIKMSASFQALEFLNQLWMGTEETLAKSNLLIGKSHAQVILTLATLHANCRWKVKSKPSLSLEKLSSYRQLYLHRAVDPACTDKPHKISDLLMNEGSALQKRPGPLPISSSRIWYRQPLIIKYLN